MKYRVHLSRDSEQIVELDTEDVEGDDSIVTAAKELADSADWSSEIDVNRIEVSEDDGATWRSLPMSEVLRLEGA